MKRILGTCLALSAFWLAGACGDANASKAQDASATKSKPNKIVIQGATIIETITDERVIEAMRQKEYFQLCSSPSTATLDVVQIEEFEGQKYLTTVVNDKNGQCSVGSQEYEPGSMPGYAPKADRK